MAIDQRSYSGKVLRPAPEVEISDDLSFGAIVTPWGPRQAATRAIEILRDYTLSARQDVEATSPFQKLSSLSPLANSLRVAIMLVNDSLYREENKSEYITGVEVLAFACIEGELAYAQVGSPHLLLSRRGLPYVPLTVHTDLSTELSDANEILPPLPQNLLGLHTTSNMNVASFRVQKGDRLICLSHSLLIQPTPALPYEQTNLDSLSHALAKQYPSLPFWIGVLEI